MKLQYLGTAAAEGIPAMFCECPICEEARKKGGRSIRTRSQAILNDELLIDFPADTYLHELRFGLKLWNIHSLLITHSHSDHLYPSDFGNRKEFFGYFSDMRPLKVYGESEAYRMTKEAIQHQNTGDRLIANRITPGVAFQTDEGYRVLPLPANHDPASTPVIFLIEKDETDENGNTVTKSLLYGNDTGYFTDAAWEALAARQKPLSLVSLDCTSVLNDAARNGHMGLKVALEVIDRMKALGCIDEHTVIVLNHFSHNGGINYDALQEKVRDLGILVSYDGMEVTF